MIVRAPRKQRDFTILSNAVCQDSRLSPRALGVLVRILSRPDDWRTTSDLLAADFGVGRDSIRSAMNELREAGYMQLHKVQNESGHWSTFWTVHEEPEEAIEDNVAQPKTEYPAPEKPASGDPVTGDPTAGNPGALSKNYLTKDYLQRTNTKRGDDSAAPPAKPATPKAEYSDEFENAWASYPKRPGASKKAAYKAWNARLKAGHTVDTMTAGIARYAIYVKAMKTEPNYIKQPETFLGPSEHFLADWEPVKQAHRSGGRRVMTDEERNAVNRASRDEAYRNLFGEEPPTNHCDGMIIDMPTGDSHGSARL